MQYTFVSGGIDVPHSVKSVCGPLGQTAPISNAILYYNVSGTFWLSTFSAVPGQMLRPHVYIII